MLKSYLTTFPCTKFVLIEDALNTRSTQIFNFLIKHHLSSNPKQIHYFVFEGSFEKTKTRLYPNHDNLVFHDCVSNSLGWLDTDKKGDSFEDRIEKLGENCVIVIDSLANLVFQHGVSVSYKFLNGLKNNKGISQIITTLHTDLLEDNPLDTAKYFSHLSTLHLKTEPKFMTNSNRLSYIYKKSGGKVYRQIEEFKFVNDDLITEKIKKPDTKSLLEKSTPKEINPETLSTFRISLTEKEKISRDKVILPYLPESRMQESTKEESQIFYQMDDMDDWDEEDPDDDLDI